MAHGQRYMQQVAQNQWIVRCKICGSRDVRKFTTAKQCHDWWREHAATAKHLHSMEYWPIRVKQRQEMARLLAKIFDQ